jgi:GT2 family glycosyltransferase
VVTLSVVIPATDGRATIDRAVRAVERARSAPEEVIVVDRPTHLGAAGARNLGVRRARGDVIVFVDADVEVHEDAFERIRAAFDSDPDLAAVFGSYDDDPGGASLVSDFRNLLHHHVHHQGAGLATTFWAGLGAVRREVFLGVGGFNERQRWLEDVELGMRLRRGGARLVLDPTIQGKHLKRWSLAGMLKTDLLHRGMPWLQLMFEDRTFSTALNLGWRNRVGTGGAVVLVFALARRNLRISAGMVILLLALDADFYRLLVRRGGVRLLAAGVPLHLAHRLTSAVAVPVALAKHLLKRSAEWEER